jgi:hypothetical protein
MNYDLCLLRFICTFNFAACGSYKREGMLSIKSQTLSYYSGYADVLKLFIHQHIY